MTTYVAHMFRGKSRQVASIAAGLLVLFVLAALKGGFAVALLFVACCVVGWLNVLGAVQSVIWRARGRKLTAVAIANAALAAFASTLLVWFGFGWALLLTTGSILLVDAIVLRFKGAPIGVPGGEP